MSATWEVTIPSKAERNRSAVSMATKVRGYAPELCIQFIYLLPTGSGKGGFTDVVVGEHVDASFIGDVCQRVEYLPGPVGAYGSIGAFSEDATDPAKVVSSSVKDIPPGPSLSVLFSACPIESCNDFR